MNRRQFLGSAFALPAAAVHSANPPAPEKPNLLVIMTDQQRSSALSCAGHEILKTPNLDRLAAQGALYRNAISPCPVCVPARTCILTGKSMSTTGVTKNEFAGDTEIDCGPSFDNLLAAAGYKTEYHGKYHAPYRMAKTYLNKVPYAGKRVPGAPSARQQYLDYLNRYAPARPLRPGEVMNERFERPYIPARLDPRYKGSIGESGEGQTFGWLQVPKEHSLAAYTVDQALEALDRLHGGPFSLTCSIGPPHPPFLNVSPYWGMYPDRDIPLPKNFHHDMTYSPYRDRAAHMRQYHVPENVQSGLSIYYGMVKEVDDNIGRLLRRLDERGLAANTLVVFMSDHGEMMGSHGMGSKMVFYKESAHVPLMMRFPGRIRPGTQIDEPVSTMDVFATVLDYLGVPTPQRESYNLRKPSPDFRVSEWAGENIPNFMVRTRDWKLIMAKTPTSRAQDALFNLKEDPYEMTNLLGAPADRARYRAQANEMKDRLLSFLDRAHSPQTSTVKERSLA